MSFVFASPQLMTAAAADVAGVGSAVTAAAHSASASTTQLLSAAGDEMSAGIAALFSAHGQQFQTLNAQAAAFPDQFLHTLTATPIPTPRPPIPLCKPWSRTCSTRSTPPPNCCWGDR